MKTLIFDPFAGCAGDMVLGALVSAGVQFDDLKKELSKLPLKNYELVMEQTERHHIACVKIDVKIGHEHAHRHLKDIHEIIDGAKISPQAANNAKRIFARLAQAEARVHNSTPEKIHFHEVGAVDAIVDIVGSCIALELIGADEVLSRPISLGSGFVEAAHGKIPLPSPATSELVGGFPVVFRDVSNELTTPTGAAIITTLAKPLNQLEQFEIEAVGYGAGSRDFPELANMLRLFVAQKKTDLQSDRILRIETNIDDMNPEIYSFLVEGLFELGARDVFTIPVQMKKNRPGTLLTVIADPEGKDKLSEFIFANSTTSGIRFDLMERVKLKREIVEFETSYGRLDCKVYQYGRRRRFYPEYDEVKRLAIEHKMSIIDLYKDLEIEINQIKE
jgi:hypothetical protein